MTSKISIIRKFFSLELKNIYCDFKSSNHSFIFRYCDFKSSNHSFIFRYYADQLTYSRSLVSYHISYREKYILDYRNNVDLYLNNMSSNIKIDDIDDFKNFDDTSLVLRYGREILDDNIVNSLNEYSEYRIRMNDFDAFLNQ